MAITISSTPSLVMPVYNPMYFDVTSSNITQPNFKYLFDIYDFTGFLTQIQLLPRPVTSNAIFSPARVLESTVSYDMNIQNIIQGSASTNNFNVYSIQFGEEYGPLSAVTQYTGLTAVTSFIFNGVLQYEQIPSWDWTQYLIGSAQTVTALFLTRQPRNGVYIKETTDRATLAMLNNDLTVSNKLVISVHHASGSSTTTKVALSGHGITVPNINFIPTGIWNINNIPNSLRQSGVLTGDIIDITRDDFYDVFIQNSLNNRASESMRYIIDDRCSMYQPVRVQFLNSLGGYDYFNFNLVSRKTLNVTRNTYKKNLPIPNYSIGDREKSVLDIDGNIVYELNSDWVTNEESEWMEELLKSININIIDSNGNAFPVLIQEGSVEIQKSINNRLMQYAFNFETAYTINGQRA